MKKKLNFAIVGNGKFANDIIDIIACLNGAEVILCFDDPSQKIKNNQILKNTCKKYNINFFESININDNFVLEQMKSLDLDYIVSANNFQIFGSKILGIPIKGILNFHIGPLPLYGGLNPCSWAIFNDEKKYGVTWHLVDNKIDTGPIVAQTYFKINFNENAISLIMRSLQKGIDLFKTLLPKLLSNNVDISNQDINKFTYFKKNDFPFQGKLPWWESYNVLKRLNRAIDFHPIDNLFFYPSIKVDGYDQLLVREFDCFKNNSTTMGKIEIIDNKILIHCYDSIIYIQNLYDINKKIITFNSALKKYGLKNEILSKFF